MIFIPVELFISAFNLLASSLCQNLLDSLLFLQKESSHDARLDTGGTAGSSVSTGDLAFALLQSMIFGRLDVLNSLQGSLAITASGSLGGLVDSLRLQSSTGSSDASSTMLSGVVRVTACSCPTVITHDEIFLF
jgi:hypothetical protein